MTDLDVDALVPVAQAATQTQWAEEWFRCHADGYFEASMGAVPDLVAYFKAFDPPTVLALLAEVAALRQQVAEVEAEREMYRRDARHALMQRDEAQTAAAHAVAEADRWIGVIASNEDGLRRLRHRSEAAEQTVSAQARVIEQVRALVDKPGDSMGGPVNMVYASDIRAALAAAPTPPTEAEGVGDGGL